MENKGKFIVFEGISGSGKSTLINAVKEELQDSIVINWFDNEFVRDMLLHIEESINMTRDMFSLSYAIDFWGKYKYYIQPRLHAGNNLLFHRYIYTPLAHDVARGTKGKKVEKLYKQAESPDKIVFLNVSPKTALARIRRDRKPSFYECGLDFFYFENMSKIKKDYDNDRYEPEQLYDYFINFQSIVNERYVDIFSKMDNVLWLEENEINESAKNVIQFISG